MSVIAYYILFRIYTLLFYLLSKNVNGPTGSVWETTM
jgi:hypothetical protein